MRRVTVHFNSGREPISGFVKPGTWEEIEGGKLQAFKLHESDMRTGNVRVIRWWSVDYVEG